MAQKNISTPIKPPKISSITLEENEEIHNKLSKLEDQLNDLSVSSIASDELVGTAGVRGIICDLGGNTVMYYAWGLSTVSNNVVEEYALWIGLILARDLEISKISILGDSMMVVRSIIKRKNSSSNVVTDIILDSLTLLKEIEEHSCW
jgi:hypothetical protein